MSPRFFRKGLVAVGVVCFASLSAGCALSIEATNPRPNIAIAPQPKTLKLAFGTAVFDKFEVPNENGIMGGHVEGWRATLSNGFQNGFADAFRVVPGPAEADLVLTIQDAELQFVPAAVNGMGNVVAATAQLRYKAMLSSRDGAAPRLVAGTAESKQATADRSEATRLAKSAVETMYEQIAAKLFADPGAAPAPSGAAAPATPPAPPN